MRIILQWLDINLTDILTEQMMPLIFLTPTHIVTLDQVKEIEFHHHLLVTLVQPWRQRHLAGVALPNSAGTLRLHMN